MPQESREPGREDVQLGSALPPGVDISSAQAARMYDYYLHGKDNFPVDRVAADEALRAFPSLRITALENRAFLGRAVEYLVEDAGIDQFLDIGAGLPTARSTHEIAQDLQPHSRVVYVDHDPAVVAHARSLGAGRAEGAAVYLLGDLRDPGAILEQPQLRQTLDLDRPVGLILNAVLHFLTDQDKPYQVVQQLLAALAPGSYLEVSHITADHAPAEAAALVATYNRAGMGLQQRSSQEIARFFEGLELVPPGVVDVSRWQADFLPQPRPSIEAVSCYGAVGRLGR
ncbi:SAM-dependent methyltransferase [Streptacidiphilus sp. PAMC 29251]